MPTLPSNSVDTQVKSPSAKTADDILDVLNTVDDEPEIKEPKEKEIKEPKDDDEIELVEPEEEVEKLDLEGKDEELEIDAPPRKKEILKEYPELFKRFPFLEKIMYRDKMYNELFGSFDDAKEAATQAENFREFEKQLFSGNTEQILKEIKESDQKAFHIIVDDYMSTLAKVDREAYLHVTGNLNKRLIMEMVKVANDESDDDLKEAAAILHKFIFGNSKFEAPKSLVDRSSDKDEKTTEQEEERLSYERERFENIREDIQTKVDNTLRATISDYIDPRNTMSPYVKKNAVNDAMKYLVEYIHQDSSVQKNLDRLWKASYEDRYSKDSTGKIQSFYLSRARANLKRAILKARSEALKENRPAGRDKEPDDNSEDFRVEEESPRTKRIPTGRPHQPQSGKNQMRKGETVADFFMRD